MGTDIYEILDTISESTQEMVLATIVNVDGSSYKKAGSTMLFHEDGVQTGLLSGGCLEEDLKERCKEYFHQKGSTLITYDLTAEDDLSWGQGVGCNGTIKVLIESITPELMSHLKKVRELTNHGISVSYIKQLSLEGDVYGYLFYTENAEYFGQWKGDFPQKEKWQSEAIRMENDYLLFKQEIQARPRLFIYGAGADARPLAQLAQQSGYGVIVADWRPAYCHKDYFPSATETVVRSPEEFLTSYTFSTSDSIVLMTHHFQKDLELVKYLLKKQLSYLGILGSKDRAQRLLQGKKVQDWVHSPVGLSIGAEGPHEIAVSIVAELIEQKARRCVNV
ncbi:XdhC family protein [Metabacillus litoralis]|uniref:XdhC family protein n=1 Tax=Metabacillus litoralis TaxID=152268 RepID=UPI000EF5BC19|nr:XdhC family protein [Metabacillus litoralis]